MRDVIWTIIVIWVIYKLIDIFRSASQRKSFAHEQTAHNNNERQQTNTSKKDIRSAIHKSAEKEGEYIDYEEVK